MTIAKVLASTGEYGAAGEGGLIVVPRHLRADGVVTPNVHCHGRSSTALEALDGRGYTFQYTLQRIMHAGVPFVSGDLTTVTVNPAYDHWGNDSALAKIDLLIAWMAAKFGTRTDKITMTGGSMGVLTCLNYARANPGKVLAIGGQFPALNMTDAGLSGYQSGMNTAYGSNAAWSAALATHNPANYAASMTVPTRLLFSGDDTVTRPAPVSAYAAAATNVETRQTAAGGAHVVGVVSADEQAWIADWIHTYALAA